MENVFNLDAFGVKEMTKKEMVKVEGGSFLGALIFGMWIGFAIAAFIDDLKY
jgi:Na+/H+ antiporter NhaD/arsenite permease-like protein